MCTCIYIIFFAGTCYTGQVNINGIDGGLPGVSYFREGYVEICRDGSYVPFCNKEFSQELADYICRYNDYG